MRNLPPASLDTFTDTPGATARASWPKVTAIYAFVVIVILASRLFSMTDYLGPDNDDALRLVEVRDLLNGQDWFDMTQHRLGLEGGTLMHWSRLVDLPIAMLISFFRLFLDPRAAEATGVAVWPLLLTIPLLFAVAATSRPAGEKRMHAGLALAGLFIFGVVRFAPGAIDHHNVQLALVATMMLAMLDARMQVSTHVLAGLAAGLAIAIGVETTPLVAGICLVVALRWMWHGKPMQKAAQAFGLSLAATVSIAFYLTVPPRLYGLVTCDNLSTGFYTLATFGGGALFLNACALSSTSRVARLAGLIAASIAVGAAAMLIAPQCLQNPLDSLDPLLKTLWLDHVEEAQSFSRLLAVDPVSVAPNYVVPALAMMVCVYRLYRRREVEMHIVLLGLLLLTFFIALFQVRGATFANFIAVYPAAAVLAHLHDLSRQKRSQTAYGLLFAAASLIFVPSSWAIASVIAFPAANEHVDDKPEESCSNKAAMNLLASQPTGVVAAPSNLGAAILRFTTHRVLSGPYHRDQQGMLAELNIGLSTPVDAQKRLKDAGVELIAFCRFDPQVRLVAEKSPGGFYAALASGKVPDYLTPIANPTPSGLVLYKVR